MGYTLSTSQARCTSTHRDKLTVHGRNVLKAAVGFHSREVSPMRWPEHGGYGQGPHRSLSTARFTYLLCHIGCSPVIRMVLQPLRHYA